MVNILNQMANHFEANIKREITALYKMYFGKGPDFASVRIFDNIVSIRLDGALSQLEESLASSAEGRDIVTRIRYDMLLGQSSNYIPTVEKIVNSRVDDVSYVMGRNNKSMYMFLIFAMNLEI